MSLTESITWQAVADGLPDADLTVLCAAGDNVFEGFLDGEDGDGRPIFRDVTAVPVRGVTHWADLPEGPAASPASRPAEREALADAQTQNAELLAALRDVVNTDWVYFGQDADTGNPESLYSRVKRGRDLVARVTPQPAAKGEQP